MKQIWTSRLAQATGKYSEHAPMATVCCNACRTCVMTNVLAVVAGSFAGIGIATTRFTRRFRQARLGS